MVNRHIPLLFQFFETTARVVTKAVLYAKSELCLAESCILFVKLGLIELLESLQYLFKRFGRIDIDRPLAIADAARELVHRLAPMNLSLASPQASKETFEIVVGAPAFGPSIAGEKARPTLPERRTDMRHCFRIFGTCLGMLLQFRQKLFDLPFDLSAGWARLIILLGRIQSSVQFDQPIPLTFEPAVLGLERAATLDNIQEPVQDRMAPFLRLRWREASKRVRSSKTRSPPSANGDLLPSVRVVRIRSA